MYFYCDFQQKIPTLCQIHTTNSEQLTTMLMKCKSLVLKRFLFELQNILQQKQINWLIFVMITERIQCQMKRNHDRPMQKIRPIQMLIRHSLTHRNRHMLNQRNLYTLHSNIMQRLLLHTPILILHRLLKL